MKRTIFLVLVLFSQHCVAGIYKWTDKNGGVHYGDSPPSNTKAKKIVVRVNSYKHATYKDIGSFTLPTGNKVVMFGTSWCTYCKMARKYFKAHNISYTDYDIEKNPRAKQIYDQFGVSTVPVILVGKRELVGFSASAFERMYKHK